MSTTAPPDGYRVRVRMLRRHWEGVTNHYPQRCPAGRALSDAFPGLYVAAFAGELWLDCDQVVPPPELSRAISTYDSDGVPPAWPESFEVILPWLPELGPTAELVEEIRLVR